MIKKLALAMHIIFSAKFCDFVLSNKKYNFFSNIKVQHVVL